MKTHSHQLIITAVLVISLVPARLAYSAVDKTFNVTVVTDTVDVNPGNGKCADSNGNCSLRAAVMEANARAGEDSIKIPEDTFQLTRTGPVDDNAFMGDLDIEGKLTITGAGVGKTVIDGADLNERLFEIQAGAGVSITQMTIRNAKEFSDSNDQGGGIRNLGTLTLFKSRVTNNRTSSSGGGIYNAENATLNLINSQVDNNYAPSGGGIYNAKNAHLTVEYGEIYKNSATYGGGISNEKEGGQALISYSTIQNNGALIGGGIDIINGFVSLDHSIVSGNFADEAGGGIYVALGEAVLTNSTISTNTTCQEGAGIRVASGKLSGYNITVADNKASSAAVDESCLNYGFPKTFTGGGLKRTEGDVYFFNSIIADNLHYNQDGSTATDDCNGKLAKLRFSLLGNSTGCVFTNEGSITDQNAKLGALDDNGGYTRTQALLEGSPAVDAGSPNGCKDMDGKTLSTDQRGYLRPFDGDGDGSKKCDMGAYEQVNFNSYNYLPFLGN